MGVLPSMSVSVFNTACDARIVKYDWLTVAAGQHVVISDTLDNAERNNTSLQSFKDR